MSKYKFWRLNFIGLVFSLIFLYLSVMPSLLPRPPLYQGLISGISIAIGYAFGVLISKVYRWLFEKEPSADIKQKSWKVFFVAAPTLLVFFIWLGAKWQNQVKHLLGEGDYKGLHIFTIFVIAFIVFWLIILISRLIKYTYKKLEVLISKFINKKLSLVISFAILAILLYWLFAGILGGFLVDLANNIYSDKNNTTEPGITQTLSEYRSGSPKSLISWDSLGYQGRNFVARGPNQTQLQSLNGQEPKQQIRIYSGLQSAPDAQSRAELVLKEMERTNAFSRKIIVLATATGTGWLEPQAADSLEYIFNGDSAIVTQQYSYLPSWISFLVDKQNATDAGNELFNAVYGKWSTLPKETRPKMIAYGLSLGSFGGQAAYSGVNDIVKNIDGALFIGTPSNTTLWQNVTNNRDKGSPEWQPIYQNGVSVRFAATNENITQNQTNWRFPRVLYVQHASDPVVWFNFNLILRKPDWLTEKRGPDVSPNMHWYPFVTFLQVTVDQFFGVNVPNGHGHNYPNTNVNSWLAVQTPLGWTSEKTKNLQDIISTYSNE